MPDYRISSAKLLRLALLASGGDTPKFDEVFGILREAQPVLDTDAVQAVKADDMANVAQPKAPLTFDEARRNAAIQTLPEARPLPPLATGSAPIGPVTEGEANATGTADLAPTKPE